MELIIIIYIAYWVYKNYYASKQQEVRKDVEVLKPFPINKKGQKNSDPKTQAVLKTGRNSKRKNHRLVQEVNQTKDNLDSVIKKGQEELDSFNQTNSDSEIFEDAPYVIEDPDLAISTVSVFEDVDLKQDIEDAELRYSGEDIEDTAWMDLSQEKVLMNVDHSLNVNQSRSSNLSFKQEDLVKGIIFNEILQRPKSLRK